MNRKIILAVVICIASIKKSYCQNELDTITITNAFAKQSVASTGRNIITIRGEQFLKLPVHSIDELLRYVPGLEVQTRGIAGSQSDIVLRGGTFQQVLVIIDGMRVNDPNTGHFNSYIPVSPSEIDRIEILKGASSAVYGSEAVGGVVHIITKTFAASQKGKKINASLGVGENGWLGSNVGGAWGNGKTFVSGGILTAKSDGEQQRGTRGYFNNKTVSLSANHFLKGGWNIALRSAYDTRKFAAQNFYTTFLSDTANEQVKMFWNQLKIGYEKSKLKFSLQAGYKHTDDTYRFNPSSAENSNQSALFQTLALFEKQVRSGDVLVTGLQFQQKMIRSNDRGDHSLQQLAPFAIFNKRLGNVNISPSLRLDYISGLQTEVVPQLNVSVRLHQLQLRASGGKTIRDADFTERYNNYNKARVTGGRIGNPDLDPERSWSYEAGADYFQSANVKVSATFFQRFQKNLIDYTPTPYADMPRKDNLIPTGSYALAKNIARVTTTGAELDGQYSKQINPKNSIFTTIGLVWLKSTSSDTVPSFYISSHAKFIVNFNVQYTYRKLSVSMNGVYKNRNPQQAPGMAKISSDCFMANARAQFTIVRSLVIFAQGDNIFNHHCNDLLGAQLPGRWFSGGLQLEVN